MKSGISMLELAFTLIFMVMSIPLMVNLVTTQNTETMKYYQDKSTYEKEDIVGLTNGVPSYIDISAGIPINYAGAMFIPLIQDKYCPAEARNIFYCYDYDTNYQHRLSGVSNLSPTKSFTITNTWKSGRTAQFLSLTSNIYYGMTNSNLNQYARTGSYRPGDTLPSGVKYYQQYNFNADGTIDVNNLGKHQLYIVWLKEHNCWAIVNSKTYEF